MTKRLSGPAHVLDLRKAVLAGEHLHAANDAGTATPEERRLAALCDGGPRAAQRLGIETPTQYAQRRARESDARALDLQLNGSGVR